MKKKTVIKKQVNTIHKAVLCWHNIAQALYVLTYVTSFFVHAELKD